MMAENVFVKYTIPPAPLVQAEVDLRDFQFMPLDVRRLRDSRMMTAFPAEQVVAAIMLWCASWHQVPAASLPDDDVELSQLAGYGRAVNVFKTVKDGALHQFVKCSDGRLYHPVVAEKALTAWQAKVDTAHRRDRDRYRKANGKEASFPDVDEWNRQRISVGIDLAFRWKHMSIPLESLHASVGIPEKPRPNSTTVVSRFSDKGEGEGEGRDTVTLKDLKPVSSEPAHKPRRSKPAPQWNGATVCMLPVVGSGGSEIAITQEFIDEMQQAYPSVDCATTLREIRAWCLANPGKRKTAGGAHRFVQSWFAREQNRG